MKRVFGVKKDKEPTSSLQDASDRITKRGDNVEEKIKKLDAELARYEGQRHMLYNQTFKLDQAAFAAEEAKDTHQAMLALKSANKELKGMMKTVKIHDVHNLQDEMTDLLDVSVEVQESLGRSYNVPDDIDEYELLDGDGVPAYLQCDKEPELEAELNMPSAPSGNAQIYAGRPNVQTEDEQGLPAVARASLRG
ncbi:hypothetical protein ACS0TY_009644 [Phlomoides rotata]